MLINPGDVVNGALVSAIAEVCRELSSMAAGFRNPHEIQNAAHRFEAFVLPQAAPELADLLPASEEHLAAVLGGVEVQAALRELLAARLTDAPEADASRAREVIRVALSGADPETAAFAGVLAGYYHDQLYSLAARLEAEEPSAPAQVRSMAFSIRSIAPLGAIERNTAALTGKYAHGCRLG